MSSLHQFLDRNGDGLLGSSSNYLSSDIIDVSEIWVDDDTSEPKDMRRVVHSRVAISEIGTWLEGVSSSQGIRSPNSSVTCAIRFVWIEYDARQDTYDVDIEALAQIRRAFQLEEVQKQSASCYSWSTRECLQSKTGPSPADTKSAYFGKHPRISLTWSCRGDGNPPTTNVICMAQAPKIRILRELLNYGFVQRLVHHEMLLLFLAALLLIKEVEETQEMIKNQIREVEVRTGYHIWWSRREQAALGDLNSLSAKMSGCESKIAEVLRKVEVTSELARFVYQQLERTDRNTGDDDAGHSHLRSYLDVVLQRAKMQRIDADFYAQRAKCQLTALFHLIAQNDNVLGHEIASDSRLLALAAQRDSSSVKSLAVVTMVFLPGTFVASLFSMPLFDFDAASLRDVYRQSFWGPRLLGYAVVTVPLMMLTFAICSLWLYYQRLQRRKQRYGAQTQLNRGLKVTELDALAKRRISTVGSEDGTAVSDTSQKAHH